MSCVVAVRDRIAGLLQSSNGLFARLVVRLGLVCLEDLCLWQALIGSR